jgi:dTDP-4-dehydrorhamnose 3,5-epimerase
MQDKIIETPLKKITVSGGDVFHFLRKDTEQFCGFGEVYFSNIEFGKVKAWKYHHNMIMNLAVPSGSVKFVFWIEEANEFIEFTIGNKNYSLLTVCPGVWFGFKGKAEGTNLIANFSNILHDPTENKVIPFDSLDFNWEEC